MFETPCQKDAPTPDLTSMVAKFNGKCIDRCGLQIHAGHDEIESGHYGFRHEDCERARLEAWVRERLEDGMDCCDVQFGIAKSQESAELKMLASCYALTYVDKLAAEYP